MKNPLDLLIEDETSFTFMDDFYNAMPDPSERTKVREAIRRAMLKAYTLGLETPTA